MKQPVHKAANRRCQSISHGNLPKIVELLECRRLLSAAIQSGGVALDSAGELSFDNNGDITRGLTPAEKQWLIDHPDDGNSTSSTPTSPPTGLIDSVGEYEQMEGLVLSWAGTTAQKNIIAQIAQRVTVQGGGRIYLGVTSATQSAASTTLSGAGADMSKVTFFNVTIDTIWARDYGPRYVYEGNVRIIADHDYNRPRPNDDNQPVVFSQFKKQQLYQMGSGSTALIHGGGNYHLSGTGDAYATTLVQSENPSLTATTIQNIWNTYQGNNTTILQQFPTSIDSTGHIDMWMQIFDDHKAFISDWPNNSGSTQDVICDNAATLLQSRGYTVTRLPAYTIGGVHYTYANMVMFNNVVLVPTYNGGPGAATSNSVFAQIQAALPAGKTAYQINGDALVTSAGVFHCIVQHLPVERGLPGPNGGLAPVAYVRGPNNSLTLQNGQQYNIQWISDDDGVVSATDGVQGVNILLSTDGGATYPTTLATNQPANGSFLWTIPTGINTTQARIKVVARDALSNTGFDENDSNFTIVDTTVPSTAPGQPALAAGSDTGASNTDGRTRLNNSSAAARLVFDVPNTISGATVSIFVDGILVGSSVASGATTSVQTNGSTSIGDGSHAVTARQTEPGHGQSPDSAMMTLAVDTVAPTVNSADFGFETSQRVNIQLSEAGLLTAGSLRNLSTGEVLGSVDLTVENSGLASSVRPATGLLSDGNWRFNDEASVVDIAGNVVSTSTLFNFFVLAGDANRDRNVNLTDFTALAANFGQTGRTFSEGDFNYSGDVSLADFTILAAQFGKSVPAAALPRNILSSSSQAAFSDEPVERYLFDVVE